MSEFLLTEKYRPKTVAECILPPRLKTVFQGFVDKRQIPNLMLTGGSGIGKTTAAKAMCEEVGCNYLFINSSEERGIDTLRTTIREYASTISFDGGQKVIILDEADYLTPEAQAALRGAIEEFSTNATFILTCNFKSRLIEALHSRCSVVDFTLKPTERPKMAALFYKRLETILKTEGIQYEENALAKIIENYFPDYRRILNEIQQFSNFGAIDAGVVAQISNIRKLGDLVKYLKEKDFYNVRKWVSSHTDYEPTRIYRKIYESLNENLKKESIPQAILILAKYQYQAAFVADHEINLVACLTEIMVDCEFK